MKRSLAMILALALAFTLASCGAPESPSNNSTEPEQTEQPTQNQDQEQEPAYVPHDPIVFTGSGDDVLEIESPDYYFGFRITGNAVGKHFAVKTYNSSGGYGELLVNTTDEYSGVTYDPSLDVSMIEVTAEGEWTIEVIDLITLDIIETGDTITGNGDYVFSLYEHGKTATISGNAAGHYFAVKSYDNYGRYSDLLVSSSDPYEGKVMLGNDDTIVSVTAIGDWSFTLN